jgi:3-oxoacyl-(acyl-carrier-protein) synthase III
MHMAATIPATTMLDQWTPRVERRALRVSLLGTGAAVPSHIVPNDHFVNELKLDTTAQWIQSRTGIVQRRHADREQRTSDLAIAAAREALEQSKVSPDDLDLIIVATSTPDYTMPATACLVQNQLQATKAIGLDVVNACAGFVYAFDVALRYVNTGVRKALVTWEADWSTSTTAARASSLATAPVRWSSVLAERDASWRRTCALREIPAR